MCATCPARLIPLDLITLIYLVNSTNYEVSRYVIFSSLLLRHPS